MTTRVCLIENRDADEFEKDVNKCLEDIGPVNLLDIKYQSLLSYNTKLFHSALIIYKEDT